MSGDGFLQFQGIWLYEVLPFLGCRNRFALSTSGLASLLIIAIKYFFMKLYAFNQQVSYPSYIFKLRFPPPKLGVETTNP
jgi:hypothetical protein